MVDENVKIAFSKVKEDIDLLKKGLKKNEKAISDQNELLGALNGKIELLLESKRKKEEKSSFFEISTGNKGVDNNCQQSTINNRQWQTMSNEEKPEAEIKKSIQTINETLTSRFDSLTDREFAIYLAIYDFEKEKTNISYEDIALRLKITESSVRSHVAHLLSKKVPLTRERYFNRRSSLSIKKGFKNPEILDKLLKLRQKKNTQTTLFDV